MKEIFEKCEWKCGGFVKWNKFGNFVKFMENLWNDLWKIVYESFARGL